MEKAISTALLIMATVVATVALINAVIPALGKSSSALVTANSEASDRIKTDTEIVHVTGDDSANTVTIWVKNIGALLIKSIDTADIFLDTATSVHRLTYEASCSDSCWDYSIEGSNTAWIKTATVKFNIKLSSLSTGVHTVRVSVFNGVSADKDFSI